MNGADNTPVPTQSDHTIKTGADMFSAFLEEEKKRLDQYELKHAPTVGAMYEGLSVDLLNKTLPEGRVSSGFVIDQEDRMSGRIDCMLVRGSGEPVPYIHLYKWPIWDVLTVFEVKKSLTKEDLRDSFFSSSRGLRPLSQLD
jgi:hypothetical protein